MMRKVIILWVMLLTPIAFANILVEVNIPQSINGNIAYLNFSEEINDKPQKFLLDWENQGSISCRVRVRIDFYNGTSLVYTGWSKEVPLEPGDHSDFEVYFYPKNSGNFTAEIFIYQCNEIWKATNVTFTASMPQNIIKNATNISQLTSKTIPFDVRAESTESHVEIKIKAKEDINGIIIVPERYPLGWIFEGGQVNTIKENEEKTISLGYVPSIWKPEEIELNIVTLDGRYHKVERIRLEKRKKGYNLEHILLASSSMGVIILTILLLREKRK